MQWSGCSVLLVPFVALGAAPSLRTWRLHAMYFVKFDGVVLFELKGWAAATLLRAAPLAAIWLGLPARSRTCPPRFQTLMPLALFVACWAAPLQPSCGRSLDPQLGAAGDLACWSTLLWELSGKGKCTSERKAGCLDLPLVLWTILPFQVTISSWAAASSEAAFVGCFALLPGQLQPAAAFVLHFCVVLFFSTAAALDLLGTKVAGFCLLVGACSVLSLVYELFGILVGPFLKYPDDGAEGFMGTTTRQHASPGETDSSPGRALPAAAAHFPVEQVLGFKRPGNEQSSTSKFTRLFIRDLKGKTFLFQWDLGWDLEHTHLAVSQTSWCATWSLLFDMEWTYALTTSFALLLC